MATLAHALLQCCLLASQKVQNGGSVWKENETHLNQKEQRVESFSLTRLPESQQQATAQCMLSQCSRIIASSRACSVYLSLPSQPYLLGLHMHRMYSRKIGILYVSKWSFSMTWNIISTIEFFFPFSPGVLFKFYFRIKFYHAKFYFLPDRVLSLLQQDIISSPSNPDIPLLEPLFDSALYYNHSHIEFFSLVTIKP